MSGNTLYVNDIIEATTNGGKVFPAKAWINFQGTGTITIRDDGNCSSIADRTTGEYTVNFSSSMPSSHYCLSDTCSYQYQTTLILPYSQTCSSPSTTSQAYVQIGNEYEGGTVQQDYQYVSLAAFGG